MKNKKHVEKYVNIIIYIILIGIIITLLNNQNFMIGKGINVIKQKSETEQVTNLQKQLDELNVTQTKYADYIQSCKNQIATALTNEGVNTSNEDKLETMAENISKILQARTSDATAIEEDILEGKTAYVNGNKVIGTITNRGELNWNPTTLTSYTVPAGYYSGGTISNSNVYNEAKKITATKLCDLSSSAKTINLSSYDNYQNFSVGNNIFMLVSTVSGGITGDWGWYRNGSTSSNLSLTYNASTGVLNIPANTIYSGDLSGRDSNSGTAKAYVSVSASVYLVN